VGVRVEVRRAQPRKRSPLDRIGTQSGHRCRHGRDEIRAYNVKTYD
jgi:hypothetical protein